MRAPDDVLAELGAELRAAHERPRKRRLPLLARPRHAILVAAAALALVPGAVATRDAIFAGDPPPFPEALRTPGAAPPGQAVYVARGAGWALSAASCADSVSVFLEVPGGGAGGRCDVAPQKRVHTYYEPDADRTWVFGVAPARARAVTVAGRRVATTPVPDDARRKGRLPAGLTVFVARFDGVVQP